ncbi:unnamed protein product [Urochloa humidicola]
MFADHRGRMSPRGAYTRGDPEVCSAIVVTKLPQELVTEMHGAALSRRSIREPLVPIDAFCSAKIAIICRR